MTPSFDARIVRGPLAPVVFRLAWPAVLQYLLVGLQGVVSHTLVGHFMGHTANAAIGVASQVFLVVLVFVSSLYTGMALLVARYAGSGDADMVNRVVAQALLASSCVVLGILVPAGYVAAPWLLDVLNAAPAVKAQALPYLRLLFLFGAGNMTSFLIGGALRASGDARTPLILAGILISLNIALDIVLIPGAGPIPALGTTGAAMGNVMAGAVAAAAGLYVVFSGRRAVHLDRRSGWRPDGVILRAMVRTGLPAALQGLVMAVGGVVLIGFVGAVQESAAAQAAYAIGFTQLFSLVTWPSLGLMAAASVVAGQNAGANRPERSVRGVALACGVGAAIALAASILFLSVPAALIGVFGVEDPHVVAIGIQLLRYLSLSSIPFAVGLICLGGLQGAGDTRSPLLITLFSQIALPVVFCITMAGLGELTPGIVWQALVMAHVTRCALAIRTFRRGQWRATSGWALARA